MDTATCCSAASCSRSRSVRWPSISSAPWRSSNWPRYSAFYLGQGPAFLGYLYGVGTLGAGAGALAINRIPFEHHVGRLLAVLTVGMGFCVVGFIVTHSALVALIDMFVFGMLPGMSQVAFLAGVQATVEDSVLGRVFAADEVGSYSFVPVGQYARRLAHLRHRDRDDVCRRRDDDGPGGRGPAARPGGRPVPVRPGHAPAPRHAPEPDRPTSGLESDRNPPSGDRLGEGDNSWTRDPGVPS